MMPREFTMTEEHVKLVRAFIIEDEHSEYETGAPWVDPKRPYGNSDVAGDVLEMLGWIGADEDGYFGGSERSDEMWREKALTIHRETQVALQIILNLGTFESGNYRRLEQYDSHTWERVA